MIFQSGRVARSEHADFLEVRMADRWEHKIVYVSAERRTSTGLPGDLNENFGTWGAQGWVLNASG